MSRPSVSLIPFPRSRLRPTFRKAEPIRRGWLYWRLWVSWRWQRPRSSAALDFRAIDRAIEAIRAESDEALNARYRTLRRQGQAQSLVEDWSLWAVLIEVIDRQLGFRLRPNQIETAWALLHGEVVELRTGEGKTLASQLAALLSASVGVSVHVITVNEYLAARDYTQLRPVASWLGLSLGLVGADDEAWARQTAYDSDVVYVTNKTLVFDALRDQADQRARRGVEQTRLLGQIFAIVDEADSVLIDDATVPMILSEVGEPPPPSDRAVFDAVFACAEALELDQGAARDGQGWWRLTDAGRRQLAMALDTVVDAREWTEDLVRLAEDALYALHGLHEQIHYVIEDQRVVLIDRSTGRLVPDRKWSYGLQQFVEMKSGVPLTGETQQIEQMTQQRFFRRYHALSGLTGTAKECRAELWAIYGRVVHPVAPHRPPQIQNLGRRVFANEAEKWEAVAEAAEQLASLGRAVLVGVNDVAASQTVQRVCRRKQIEVHVLDALSEASEAAVIEAAGVSGRITIATHLAGRGTDIPVTPETEAAGGLHVMIAGLMESSRLERQLSGRTGRQGAVGSFSVYVSREDRQWHEGLTEFWRLWVKMGLIVRWPIDRWSGHLQSIREALNRRRRIQTLLREQRMAQQLGYDKV